MRREFLKKMAVAAAAVAMSPVTGCSGTSGKSGVESRDTLIVPRGRGLKITGTFLDEISHDIPHQNWGEAEWDADFGYMKAIGIDTVIMIRSGYRKFITYPSAYLMEKHGCYQPSMDWLDLFLRLATQHGMKFYFGLYDSGKYWDTGDLTWEIDDNKQVIEEVWKDRKSVV
jgi:hypothetical protein